MTFEISTHLREQFPEGYLDELFNLPEGLGYELFHQVLNVKGMHVSCIGDSRSGKTEKCKWFNINFSRMGETLIIFDSGKSGDIECYFWNDNPKWRLMKPITVLIPYEGRCQFEVSGVPEEIPILVIPVPAPELYWDFIRPGEINIISLRNYFQDIKKLKQYLRRVFKGFALRARLGHFITWTPAVIYIDEAHEAIGSQSVARDQDSILLTIDLTNMERQLASAKIRMELATQSFYDLPEGVRKNTHIFIINRGAFAEKRDNKTIHYLEGFADHAYPWQGWIVIHGRHFYSGCPIKFPEIGIPERVRIRYSGFADSPVCDDEEWEMSTDWGWKGTSYVQVEAVSRGPSISEMPPLPEEPLYGPVQFVDVWGIDGLKQEGKNESSVPALETK